MKNSPDRDFIFNNELERGLFSDAYEYNLFQKEVFGNDHPMIMSMSGSSKLNKSLNNGPNNGIKTSDNDIQSNNLIPGN